VRGREANTGKNAAAAEMQRPESTAGLREKDFSAVSDHEALMAIAATV
jgi:hypothetical protein